MNLADFNPITAVLGKVADVAQKYFPSEQDRAKFLAEIEHVAAEDQAKLEALAVDDRKSARDMQVATGSWTPAVLAAVVTGGFFGVLGYMLVYGLPKHGGEALLILLGTLGAAFAAVINYYFGSSAGSAAKTAILGRK